MAQTKSRVKIAKSKKVRVKLKEDKPKRSMPNMSKHEHEKMGHKEPMMAATKQRAENSQPMFDRDEKTRQFRQDNPQLKWDTPPSQTRQGNAQQQWTDRVAEGRRNPEPAPRDKEGEPEED